VVNAGFVLQTEVTKKTHSASLVPAYLCGSALQAPVRRGTIRTPPPTPTKLPKTPASTPTGTDSLCAFARLAAST
jgi:hypothetical protein